jgi:hypothetical protein
MTSMSRGGYRKGAGRKSSWQNSDTQLIRVPRVFAAHLLTMARKLDQNEFLEPEFDMIDSVTESYDYNTLITLALEIIADDTIVPGLMNKEVVRVALSVFIERLIQ